MYFQATRIYPARGKVGEARAALVERVKREQEMGWRVALRERILSDEGPTLVVSQQFSSLQDLDVRRRARAGDAAMQAFMAKIATLTDRPMLTGLQERLIEPASIPAKVGVVTRAF